MATELMKSTIWKSLASDYGVPKVNTQEYAIKERAYRQALSEIAVVHEQDTPTRYLETAPYTCDRCGHSSTDVERQNTPRQPRRAVPVYDSEYERVLDFMVEQQMKEHVRSKARKAKKIIVVSDSESELELPEPAPVKVKVKRADKPVAAKKKVPAVVEKVVELPPTIKKKKPATRKK